MKKSEELTNILCDNRLLQDHLKQCTPDTCSTKKQAAWDKLFELLGYGTLLSRIAVAWVIVMVKVERCSYCVDDVVETVMRNTNCTCSGVGHVCV